MEDVQPVQACMEDVQPVQACMEYEQPVQGCMEYEQPMEYVPLQAIGEQKNMHPQQFPKQSKKIMDQSHEVSLDINELANSLTEWLKIEKAPSPECCIYRVPERSRKLHRKAFTPRVVSIGPFHHGKENLKAMEDQKKTYLQQFLEEYKLSVENLFNIIKENETKLRDCYAEAIDLTSNEFATMIVLDAVFIIMVLLKLKYRRLVFRNGRSDRIFYRPFMLHNVVFDMLLLENQLPFFILEKLFELSSVAANPDNCTLIELTFGLLKVSWSGWVKEDSWKTINCCGFLRCQWAGWVKEDSWKAIDISGVLHFVDFLRKCQQPPALCPRPEETAFSRAPTATELHQYGVKFRNPERSLLFGIRFRKGILEIPQLQIDEGTESLLRNLLAFEEYHHRIEDTFVNDYISFIGCLVRAPNDVEVLSRKWKSKNMLNSYEVVSNLLDSHDHDNIVVTTNSFLWGVCEDLNLHCRRRRDSKLMALKAALKQMFVNNP
ncbi:UPF0481 protein At3g47200-like [Populus alba]|uniref:Uncharacterized protein n=1 Tax=Populus alba x Populus x berolinensis TaxID=444605 RepID=A0AAD6RA83_9ROSI|nr:UPF0481 protein At3g47200-like [Populus alba]XP_034921779.1 UPF0481 protein At3g47200-like [Populus alba]KAJ7005161.1 hypothetical protein NC653_009851 [Populus alba x Populus x berolinensis]